MLEILCNSYTQIVAEMAKRPTCEPNDSFWGTVVDSLDDDCNGSVKIVFNLSKNIVYARKD